jgi:hypothetical protein
VAAYLIRLLKLGELFAIWCVRVEWEGEQRISCGHPPSLPPWYQNKENTAMRLVERKLLAGAIISRKDYLVERKVIVGAILSRED